MALRVVGAGLGRTGTTSLKAALEHLLGAPCYHMVEVFAQPDHLPQWHAAAHGAPVAWDRLFDGYGAAVDWPASAYWRELADHYPDAVVVLSHRSAQSWWRSADATIWGTFRREPKPEDRMFHDMVRTLMARRFTADFLDASAAMAAFDRHNEHVRATVSKDRLVEWTPEDGWAPLCAALGLAVPAEPFPHRNSTQEFTARVRERDAAP